MSYIHRHAERGPDAVRLLASALRLADSPRLGVPASVAEIRFDGDRLIPVFKVPEEVTEKPIDDSTGSGKVVRVLTPVVRRGHQNANRFLLITGDPLPVAPTCGRRHRDVGAQ